MPSLSIHALFLLSLLSAVFSSPIAYPQINNATPQSTDTTAIAQTAALQASQQATVDPSSTSLINGLLAAVFMAPAINMKVSALSDTLTAFEQGIATVLAVDTTSSSPTCAPMMVIFARGTTEPGNVGLVTGPPFFDALEAVMGEGGDPAGSVAMATMVEGTVQNCPNAKIVMSGYSQVSTSPAAFSNVLETKILDLETLKTPRTEFIEKGGQLIHNAAAMLPSATMAKISSVVIFGDPNNGKPVAGADAAKTIVICHPGDDICDGGDLVLLEHLTYSKDTVQAATFAASRARA